MSMREEDLKREQLTLTAPRTYDPLELPRKKWRPKQHPRKTPPEFEQGQVLYTLSHKDLKSLVNQAVDALKKATQWQGGELETGAMMHCLQSAAASRQKAFQLIQGQMLLVPKPNPLVIFATEAFVGKVGARTPDSEWTFLRNQEVKYNDNNCIVHHLTGYRVQERGLTDDDIIAKRPGPPKSPTSYQAWFKKDYIHCKPDWVLTVTLKSDIDSQPRMTKTKLKYQSRAKKRVKRSRFDAAAAMKRSLEQAGTPWYWVYNAWEARLQVYQHSTPHASGGEFKLVNRFELGREKFDKSLRAPPFEDIKMDLRTILGYRPNGRAYA